MTLGPEDLASALSRLDKQQQGTRVYIGGLTPMQRAGAANLAAAYPHLGPVVVPLGTNGVTPDSSVARKVSQARVQQQTRERAAGQETTGGIFGKVWNATKGAVKAVSRYGFAGMSMPYEFVEGTYRTGLGSVMRGDARGALAPFGAVGLMVSGGFDDALKQTTVGAGVTEAKDRGVLDNPTQWDEVSGDGWFIGPQSKAGKRQAREARAQGLIDGHAITPGRTIAHLLPLEPGSGAYKVVSGLVDMSSALALDPTTYAGGGIAKAARSRNVIGRGRAVGYEVATRTARPAETAVAGTAGGGRTFVAGNAGLVDGVRPTVLPEKAVRWLDSEDIKPTLDHIAESTDIRDLYRRTGRKLPVDLLVKLVDARDSVQVKDALVAAIERGSMREKFVYARPGPAGRLADWAYRDRRIGQMMPGTEVDMDDMDDAFEQLERFGTNANLPHNVISEHLSRFARASTDGARYQVLDSIGDIVKATIRHNGFSERDATRWTRFWRDATEDGRRYMIDTVEGNTHVRGLTINGIDRALPDWRLTTETLNRKVPLPAAKDIRAATSKTRVARALQAHGSYRAARTFAEAATNDVFKVMALAFRPAWAVRVVGEEQVRMGAAGLASAFHHPLSYIAWLAGENESRLGTLAGKLPGIEARGGVDVLGKSFAEEVLQRRTAFAQSQNIGSSGWRNREFIHAKHWQTYQPNEEPYIDAWHDELSLLSATPEANQVARNMDRLDDVKAAWWDGNLSGLRRQMVAARPDTGYETREGADAYIDFVADLIRQKTGGDAGLMQAVAHGKIDNRIPLMHGLDGNGAAKGYLRDLEARGLGPRLVKGPVTGATRNQQGLQAGVQLYDKAAEAMFHALGAVPTNKLSRSPVFRQSYWRTVEETAGLLTRQDRLALARQAANAGMDRAMVRRLREMANAPTPEGRLTLAEIDEVAKRQALKDTRDLLYSLHEKSQLGDAVRVAVPFSEAYREVLTRWAKLGTENPLVPYRAGQMLTGGESDEGRDGLIFHPDPLTGEEMISIPGMEWITDKLVGVPVGEEMSVQGMNMFGQVLPGLGPVVTVPAGRLIPQDPSYDWLRDAIMPYGPTDQSAGIFESFFPAYFRKINAVAAEHGFTPFGASQIQKRQLASVTRDVMASLAAKGDYDLSDPEEQDRLIQDARHRAEAIYLIRGITQSTLPSAPTQKVLARDKDGRMMTLYKMAEDYRKMQESDYRTATERFIDKYGEDAVLATISKTTGPVAPTDRVNRLARSHPEVARQFPTTFGYFAPDGEVDPDEIERQVRQGTRALVGPDKAVTAANIRIAASIYARAQEKVGTARTEEERAWLRIVKDKLTAAYPGYTGGFDTGQQTATVDELLRAGQNRTLRQTQAGEALAIYRQARDMARKAAQDGGHGWPSTAQDMAGWNTWLRGVGEKLVGTYPEFGEMFDRVLSRELPAEDEEG